MGRCSKPWTVPDTSTSPRAEEPRPGRSAPAVSYQSWAAGRGVPYVLKIIILPIKSKKTFLKSKFGFDIVMLAHNILFCNSRQFTQDILLKNSYLERCWFPLEFPELAKNPLHVFIHPKFLVATICLEHFISPDISVLYLLPPGFARDTSPLLFPHIHVLLWNLLHKLNIFHNVRINYFEITKIVSEVNSY